MAGGGTQLCTVMRRIGICCMRAFHALFERVTISFAMHSMRLAFSSTYGGDLTQPGALL